MYNFEDELDKIRVEIYEELKNLTNEESSKLIGERARKIAEQFHIKIIAETPMKAGAYDLQLWEGRDGHVEMTSESCSFSRSSQKMV